MTQAYFDNIDSFDLFQMFKKLLDWKSNLKIVLRFEGKEDVAETPIPSLTHIPLMLLYVK